MEHDEAKPTASYIVPEVPIYHAPCLRKYTRIEFAHPEYRGSGVGERQVEPIRTGDRGLHQTIQRRLVDVADVYRKKRRANERLRKLFRGSGRVVIINLLWFFQAQEDNWCSSEPGGLKNWQIDDGNRALGRPLPQVRLCPQEEFDLNGS